MAKSFIELVIGSLDEKRVWRRFIKRVNGLPGDYRFAFKKILNYFYNFGCDMAMLFDLLELFEASVAEGKPVSDVIGSDAAAFCDEVIRASAADTINVREQFNKEILEHFHREEK